jgi:hypothetical protein
VHDEDGLFINLPFCQEISMSVSRFALASLTLVASLAASSPAWASITLNTTGLKATSVLTFTPAAYGSSTAAGITFSGVGNMTRLADLTVTDPETGMDAQVPVFDQPITKAEIAIGWDLKITPIAGAATRSGLHIVRKSATLLKDATLANFNVKFADKKVYADIITPAGTTVGIGLYNFKDDANLNVSFKGFVLRQTQSISQLVLTPEAQAILGDALNLSGPLRAAMAEVDWGTIAITVTSYKRTPKLSDVPLTAADIPAP